MDSARTAAARVLQRSRQIDSDESTTCDKYLNWPASA
eukprot:CAMPEP_0204339926 /NCGR_PEP_ID=MMETSP0469-20131031/22179_1 /ASSEMBLY_ACC=CAM_ASM_000384 /TAXON_ID=2969 /ORGANISM="Oxyrrhis marina" /LENGTH=36 /DNA_ID= /DNA_START= /DNA_END= /DNA_ORIENTATION=